MSVKSDIEWTDATWNPVTGCTKVSAGCANCYAETLAKRFWKDRKFTDVQIRPERLDDPLNWMKPRRIFVNSMSDLFHEKIPTEYIYDIIGRMTLAKHHTFQVLTKRPERMAKIVQHDHPNIWWGVSVEDQASADKRIPKLIMTPAVVRFISCEPLLEHINLERWQPAIDWCIVGGETGPGARATSLDWIESIVHQCQTNGIPVFVKQVGSRPQFKFENGGKIQEAHGKYLGIKNYKGSDMSEWPESIRVREFPK